MSNLAKKKLGQWGENLAAEYLVQRGYRIVEQNARTPYGEIDLVAQVGDITIFVEVKTRTTQTFGYPEEAITEQKRVHLIEASQAYIQDHPELDTDLRIDVIAIQHLKKNETPQIEHFENAVY